MAYVDEVLADSPVGYWRLDEASGTSATDASGNGRTGTYAGGPTLGATSLLPVGGGTAVTLDRSNDRVTVAHNAAFNATGAGDFTVECWVKIASPTTDALQVIADKTNLSLGSNGQWYISYDNRSTQSSPKRLRFVIGSGGGTPWVDWAGTATADALAVGGHLVARKVGATLSLWWNGAQVATSTNGTAIVTSTSTQTLAFGGTSSGGVGFFLGGTLDEVAIYGAALSDARIADHYAAATPPPNPAGTLGATLPAPIAALSGSYDMPPATGNLAATLPAPVATLSGTYASNNSTGSLAATLPALAGALSGSYAAPGGIDAGTVTTNRANGIHIGGMGHVESNPPVVPTPSRLVRGHDYVKAQAYVAPTMVDGRPVDLDITEIEAPADRDRIIVGGKDVTYFRDVQTPTPSFLLTQPLGYGATTLVFPQTHAVFEQPGVGALKWLAKEKRVRIQRVGPNGGVVGTDYVGVIIALRVQGRSWVADVGGDISGRASMRDRQPPLFRWVRDVGSHVHGVVKALRLRFEPRFGPTTGIKLAAAGGMSQLDWLNHLCSMAVKRDGTHYTLMPIEGNANVWEFRAKDTTTRHATAYFDDARIVPDLVDDLAEQPNRIFGTGVTPEGMRVKNGAYPGLKQAPAPDYPLTSGAAFGTGTTDADVDTLEGVTAMNWKLIAAGYLSREDLSDTFTAETETAVLALQADAGLLESGNMNQSTWDALFDLTATGFSIAQSRIEPLSQRNYVRPWNLTGNGSRGSRNGAYDPTRLVVDRTIDYGAGHEKQTMREWSKRELNRTSGKNWAGTIRVNLGALIRGEHTPGAPLTSADVMPLRELRPGMNVWAPLFDGGTLFHIVGINVDAGGRTGTLTVDTKYRDLLPVAEIVARNRESRRNPARAFLDQHRSSKQVKDGLITFDEVGGRIFTRVECPANEWTVFPVVAGQEGTIRKLDLQTSGAPASFAVTVWGKDPTKAALEKRLPTPLVLDEDGESVWDEERDLFRDKVLLYAAGTEEQPAGYWPRRHTNDMGNVTDAPITGRWVDDAQFSYHTVGAPVLYVAIWPEQATVLRPQRIMYPQLEQGS